MQQIVTITRQGQITIPASMRRRLDLNRNKKAYLRTQDKKIILEPILSIMDLAGSLKHKALKGRKIDQIIKLEKEAIKKAVAERNPKP